MSKPKPARSSRTPSITTPTIRVGEKLLEFHEYQQRIENLYAHIAAKAPYFKPERIARALTCARVVAAKHAFGPYEPTEYCKQPRVCPRCYHLSEQARSENLALQTYSVGNASTRKNAFSLVLTMPAPKTYEEALEYGLAATKSLPAMTKAVSHWNEYRGQNAATRIYGYALGVHFKPTGSSSLFWSHIHFSFVAGDKAPLHGRQLNGLTPYFQTAFDHATGLSVSAKVKGTKNGRLGSESSSHAKRQKQHKGKAVTAKHLENIFAYTFRIDEDDDTPEVGSARLQFLSDLGNPTTKTRSRRPRVSNSECFEDLSTKVSRPPSAFPPGPLGKSHIYRFPLDGGDPILVPPHAYDAEMKLMHEEALKLVAGYYKPLQKSLAIVADCTK